MKVLRLRLKDVLANRKITQKELSDMTGLREATISMMCREYGNSVNKENLGKIADALGIEDVQELLVLENLPG